MDNQEIKNFVATDKGEIVEYTAEMEKATEKSIKKQLPKIKPKNLLDMDGAEVEALLKKQQASIKAITDAMVEGRHFMTIPNVEGKYITQEGSDLLLRASGIKVEYELVDKTISIADNFIDYEYKAIAYSGTTKIGEAIASYNSKEDRMRKHYETFDNKTKKWSLKPNKSVFDIKNTLQQNSQKRAKNRLVRNIFAISGAMFASEDEIKNPIGNKMAQMSIYRILYKYWLQFAPNAPKKKKLKNGTWHQFTDNEKLDWRKEWCRVNILKPYLLKNGLPTNNFTVNEIKELKEVIPNLELPNKKGGD